MKSCDFFKGIITTTIELDFESLAPPAEYIVDVEVVGLSENVIQTTLTVTVKDINEPHDIANLPNTTMVDCATIDPEANALVCRIPFK